MKKNFIYSHIRKSSFYSSLLLIGLLITIFIIVSIIPFSEIFSPVEISVANSAATVYDSGVEYVDLTTSDIFYTGYDSYRNGKKTGSYYYSLVNNSCTLILIRNNSENPPQKLTNYHIQARLVKDSELSEKVIKKLAKDLNWTESGLSSVTSNVTIDETSYNYEIYVYIALSLISIALIFLSILITNIIFLIVPGFHPACINFNRLGGSIKELNQVNCEIKNSVVFKTRKIFLTEQYIISISLFNIEIIPIRAIIWVYENTANYNFFINKIAKKHTINIFCKHKIYLFLPKDNEVNINIILDFFKENYPNIIIGYSKENKEMAMRKEHKQKNNINKNNKK